MLIIGGYRQDGREKGFRPAKQPRTPQPNYATGEHLTDAKFVAAAARGKAEHNMHMQQKKAADLRLFGPAVAIHEETLKHGSMPGRSDKYHVPQHGMFFLRQLFYRFTNHPLAFLDVLYGTDVRQGAFNLACYDGKGKKYARAGGS